MVDRALIPAPPSIISSLRDTPRIARRSCSEVAGPGRSGIRVVTVGVTAEVASSSDTSAGGGMVRPIDERSVYVVEVMLRYSLPSATD